MDYNKQYFWKSENRFLDNKKLLAEVWCLKPSLKTAAVQVCTFNGIKTISDFKKISTEALVIGTELQKYNLFCEMLDNHGWQTYYDYRLDVKLEWKKMYEENNNKPFIYGTI